jgi:hypothetical protein
MGYTFHVLTEDIGDLALFSSRGPSTALPEDSSVLVLWLETLVHRYWPFTFKDLCVCFLFSPEGTGDLALFSSRGPSHLFT